MTIDVCNRVNVVHGQCMRPMNHCGRHFWRSDMESAIAELDALDAPTPLGESGTSTVSCPPDGNADRG